MGDVLIKPFFGLSRNHTPSRCCKPTLASLGVVSLFLLRTAVREGGRVWGSAES